MSWNTIATLAQFATPEIVEGVELSPGVSINLADDYDLTATDLIVVAVVNEALTDPLVHDNPTDTEGNTYIALTPQQNSGVWGCLFYCAEPSVANDMVISFAAGNYVVMSVSFYSGCNLQKPLDKETGSTATEVVSIQPGALTPSTDSDLIVTIVGWQNEIEFIYPTVTYPFDNTLTEDSLVTDYPIHFGLAWAETTNPAPTSINPIWSYLSGATGTSYVALMAAFTGFDTPLPGMFAEFIDPNFHDWPSIDDIGADFLSYLDTFYMYRSDTMLFMNTPYIFTYLENVVPDGNTGGIGCTMTPAWQWSENTGTHRWATPIELYNDYLQSQKSVLERKNRIRGRGKALQLRFESETGKNFSLLGWGVWLDKLPAY